ncbi:nucleoside-diphosphate-sugar epimerase [Kribbella pratensis]|uniref:Nucleoside-diphosphate-sugar epimerase n=1 Tax=Kribbella pratensis TaxID=2512112 RepID=A0ABY2F6D4_9ACTN|nr:SDR family oxidoreductase [Kribbella pratensis]TDW83844.1 nucleoside-diphosphate-sugar epimerase [Kribbella pratensis]
MRVFITGASGHVGSALVPELLHNGHQVLGLARSDESAKRLTEWGAEAVRGDLHDLDRLRAAAAAADGVVHLAFRHDAMQAGDLAGAAESDLAALQTIGDALAGTDKPLVSTSGTGMLAGVVQGRVATEDDYDPNGGYRIDAENYVVDLAAKGVRSSVLRLPPITHSRLDHQGFAPSLIAFARRNGFAAYIGDGTNRWSSVHTLDAARLYRLALESAPAGTRLHAIQDEAIEFRPIAEAIGRGLDLPTHSVTADEAPQYLGFLARFAAMDIPTSAARTSELLNWQPTHPDLLADLAEGFYF